MKKRQLKNASLRRPKGGNRICFTDFAQEISNRTGYRTSDIKEVWRVGIQIIMEYMAQRKLLTLPGLGMFYPWLRPARTAVALYGGTKAPKKVQNPARWQLYFKPSKTANEELLKHPPTRDEVESLYID